MQTHIAGIPCRIEFTVTGQYIPARTNAEPDYCHEAEYPDIEFEVLDRRGRPAPWLARKLTPAETQRIENEILEYHND